MHWKALDKSFLYIPCWYWNKRCTEICIRNKNLVDVAHCIVRPSVPSILTKHVYLHANCSPPLHFISVGNILLFASVAVLFLHPYLCFSVESQIVYWGWMLQKVPAIGGESRLSAPHRSKSVFSTFLSLNATLASHLGKYWCKRASHMPPPSTPLLLFQCVPQSALVCQFVAWCLDVLQEWLKHNSTCHSHMLTYGIWIPHELQQLEHHRDTSWHVTSNVLPGVRAHYVFLLLGSASPDHCICFP